MFTTHTKKRRWLAALLILAMMIGMLPASATTAQAAEPEEVPLGTVALRPEGITIDLFDYWSTQSDDDPDGGGNMENDDERYNLGINKDHYLKFGQGMGQVEPSEEGNAKQMLLRLQLRLDEVRSINGQTARDQWLELLITRLIVMDILHWRTLNMLVNLLAICSIVLMVMEKLLIPTSVVC